MASQELNAGDVWQCQVTPFNASMAGNTSSSNSIAINANVTAPAIGVTLNSPASGYNSPSSTVNFNWACAGAFGSYLSNLTINGVPNAINIAATNNTAVNESVLLSDGNDNWSVTCWNGTTSGTSALYHFTVDTTAPTVSFTPPTDNSSSTLSRSYIQINVTATDSGSGLSNITAYIYNSTGLYNSANSTTSPLFINWTGLPNGVYYFNATAYDDAGNYNSTETRNVTLGGSINCPVLSTAGQVYTMSNDFSGAPNDATPQSGTTCVKITASNVTFDCNGYNITNNGTGGQTFGILLVRDLTNVTVKNCQGASGYTYGIYSIQQINICQFSP